MKEVLSTLTSKGQVTIPKEVRRHLGLKTRDKIAFVIEDEGTVRLVVPRYPDVASLRGAAGSLEERLSWPEVRRIAREDRLQAEHPEES
jgi:antitoxin PrlF